MPVPVDVGGMDRDRLAAAVAGFERTAQDGLRIRTGRLQSKIGRLEGQAAELQGFCRRMVITALADLG